MIHQTGWADDLWVEAAAESWFLSRPVFGDGIVIRCSWIWWQFCSKMSKTSDVQVFLWPRCDCSTLCEVIFLKCRNWRYFFFFWQPVCTNFHIVASCHLLTDVTSDGSKIPQHVTQTKRHLCYLSNRSAWTGVLSYRYWLGAAPHTPVISLPTTYEECNVSVTSDCLDLDRCCWLVYRPVAAGSSW